MGVQGRALLKGLQPRLGLGWPQSSHSGGTPLCSTDCPGCSSCGRCRYFKTHADPPMDRGPDQQSYSRLMGASKDFATVTITFVPKT